ncbi:MAG: ABC transporter permease, partial [Anaerolineae bacterium]|nr:ABC transporter permease [Anaerolineae bacterium]
FVMLVLFVGALLVMQFTPYGRAMYAIGGNYQASKLAGLAVRRYRMIAYTLSGLSAGVASVLLTSRLYAADPRAATGMELTVITAAVLGGISLAGGKGTLIGTTLGVLILSALLNGMKLLSTSTDAQNIALGLVLLLAVGLDQLRQRNVNLLRFVRSNRLVPETTAASQPKVAKP